MSVPKPQFYIQDSQILKGLPLGKAFWQLPVESRITRLSSRVPLFALTETVTTSSPSHPLTSIQNL